MNVIDYVDEFVKRHAASGAIERSTAAGYAYTAARIRKALPNVALECLGPRHVQNMDARLAAMGYSYSAISLSNKLLLQAYNDAVACGLAPYNPALGVKGPKKRNKKPGINYLDAQARRRLLEALDRLGLCELSVGAALALFTSLRQGEVCGLRWGDVEFESRLIWSRRAIGRAAQGAYVKDCKDGKVKSVPMSDTLAAVLQRWRASSGTPRPSFYVLGGARHINPNGLGKRWRAFAEQEGIYGTEGRLCTFHDLRHTWATVAVAAGMDIKTVASVMGHANAAMTLNVYASADPEAKRRVARAIDGMI